jgi:hypothetical protein
VFGVRSVFHCKALQGANESLGNLKPRDIFDRRKRCLSLRCEVPCNVHRNSRARVGDFAEVVRPNRADYGVFHALGARGSKHIISQEHVFAHKLVGSEEPDYDLAAVLCKPGELDPSIAYCV